MNRPVSVLDPEYLNLKVYTASYVMGDTFSLHVIKKKESSQIITLQSDLNPNVPLLLSYHPKVFESGEKYPGLGTTLAFMMVDGDASGELLTEIRLLSEHNTLRGLRAPSFVYWGKGKPMVRAIMNALTLDFCDGLLKDDLESFQQRYVGYLLWQKAAELLVDKLSGRSSQNFYSHQANLASVQVGRMAQFLESVKSFYNDKYQVTPRFPDEIGLVEKVMKIQRDGLL